MSETKTKMKVTGKSKYTFSVANPAGGEATEIHFSKPGIGKYSPEEQATILRNLNIGDEIELSFTKASSGKHYLNEILLGTGAAKPETEQGGPQSIFDEETAPLPLRDESKGSGASPTAAGQKENIPTKKPSPGMSRDTYWDEKFRHDIISGEQMTRMNATSRAIELVLREGFKYDTKQTPALAKEILSYAKHFENAYINGFDAEIDFFKDLIKKNAEKERHPDSSLSGPSR